MRPLRYVIRHPSAALLLIQLAGVLLYPLMEEAAAGRALFGAFGVVVLGAALRLVRRSPAITWVALLLALMVLALTLTDALVADARVALALAALEGTFYLYAAGGMIAYMMDDRLATTDELFAAGATFTLLAWAFAYFYSVCQMLIPGSFGAVMAPQAPRTWMELLFLSFTILSSVGLGDIVPLTPMARALVMLEEFAGVMYIAVVVSRLIGLTVASRP